MIRVFYDDECDALWVSYRDDPFLPKSLRARLDGDQITVLRCNSPNPVASDRFDQFTADGKTPFSSESACLAYLQTVFAKSPAQVPNIVATASEDIPCGLPVALSRSDGRVRMARADSYTLSLIAGLASEDAANGFPVECLRSSLALADWSVVTSSPTLSTGQPYFLALAGGLTTTPDRTPGNCLVRVGNAADPRTFVFDPSDPILL